MKIYRGIVILITYDAKLHASMPPPPLPPTSSSTNKQASLYLCGCVCVCVSVYISVSLYIKQPACQRILAREDGGGGEDPA